MTLMRRLIPAVRLRMMDGQPILPRVTIVVQATLVLAALVYGTWLIHIHFLYARISQPSLSLAIAFLCMQSMAIVLQLGISFSIKRRGESIEERARRTQPAIREHLAAYLSGSNRTPELLKLCRFHRDQVEVCVLEALGAIRGYNHDRISALAEGLGLPDVWKKRLSSRHAHRRKEAVEFLGLLGRSDLRPTFEKCLSDPDVLVQAAASHSLLALEEPDTVRLFQLAIKGSLLLRAMVAGDLRKHSSTILRHGLAGSLVGLGESLAGTERPSIATGLEVVEAWGKSLNLPEVALLTLHPNLEVRVAAIRSLAFVEASRDTESLILAALDDPNSDVRVAAIQACLQRRLRPAIPSLQRQLHAGNEACARAACNALAGMGLEGWSILEECVLNPDRMLAAAALGALAAAQLTASAALVTE